MRRLKRTAAGTADTLFLWLACAVTLCAGCSIAFGALGRAIDAQHERTGRVADAALANARIAADAPRLERQAQLIDARLDALALGADKPTMVARFIHLAADAAAERHVGLDRIEERSTADFTAPPTPAVRPAGAASFEAIPLDVTLSGDYRSLLATIRALAHAPVTLQIEIAALERAASPAAGEAASDTRLTAHLHVSLLRLASTSSAPAHSLPEDQPPHAGSL